MDSNSPLTEAGGRDFIFVVSHQNQMISNHLVLHLRTTCLLFSTAPQKKFSLISFPQCPVFSKSEILAQKQKHNKAKQVTINNV